MGTKMVKVAKQSVTLPLRWFVFRQNNSGGSFDYDENVGIHVYIQATSAKEANNRAEAIGIYFNGCEDGRDCDCCGDRWYSLWGDESGQDEFPMIGMFIRGADFQYRDYALLDEVGSMKDGYDVFHFYDGTRQYGIPQLNDGEVDTRVI